MQPIFHPATKRRLDAIRKTPKGSYLLYGPPGVGRRTAAMWLAKRLNCLGDDTGPCRHCRQFAAGNFPDLILVSLAEDETSIKIERLRQLQHVLSLEPYTSGWRVVIIRPAEALGHEAQNSLLKLIEEPPHRTIIFLITETPECLLSTIRSRVHTAYVAPVSDEAVLSSIAAVNLPDDETQKIIAASNGRVGLAKTMALDSDFRSQLSSTVVQVAEWLEGSSLHRLAEAARLATEPGALQAFLEQMAIQVRRTSRIEIAGQGAALAALEACHTRLKANGNARVALESLALEADNA